MRVRIDCVYEFFGVATRNSGGSMYLRRCGRPSDPHARSFLSGAHGPGGGGQQRVAVRVEAEEAEDEAEEEPRRKRADGQAGRRRRKQGREEGQDSRRMEGSCIRVGARIRIRIPSIPIDNLSRSTHSLFSFIALTSLPPHPSRGRQSLFELPPTAQGLRQTISNGASSNLP